MNRSERTCPQYTEKDRACLRYLSDKLGCNLNEEEIAICTELCTLGVDPEDLSRIVIALREQIESISRI